jgi:hypothetical protein
LNWKLSEYRGDLPIGLRNYVSQDPRNVGDYIYAEIYDDAFLHFRAGSNWKEEAPEIVKLRHLEFLRACFV